MDIKEQLQLIFREVFKDPNLEISPELTAHQVAHWDSITHLVMISKVEEVFNVKLKLKELMKLKNVGDLLSLLTEKTIA
jgi:acyl carrier protein